MLNKDKNKGLKDFKNFKYLLRLLVCCKLEIDKVQQNKIALDKTKIRDPDFKRNNLR